MLPDRVGIYNKTLPGTYQWETHNPDTTRNLVYVGPEFKEPPRHYPLSPNFPKENYSPTIFARYVRFMKKRSLYTTSSLSFFVFLFYVLLFLI